MSGDDLTALSLQLAAEFPATTVRRGWTVMNLAHSFEMIPFGTEERWSVEFVGPSYIDTTEHRFADRQSFTSSTVGQGVLGTVWARTPDGLVDQVRQVVDTLGLRDLKDARPRRGAPSVATQTAETGQSTHE